MLFPNAIPLNEGWRFALGDPPGAERADFNDADFTPVALPHDWQISARRDPDMEMGWSQGYYPRAQAGWYRLRLVAPEAWRGKRAQLKLEGCQRFYEVYLNGERIGGHRYGYVPLLLPLNGLVYGAENWLCIRVNNADTLGDRWYSGAGLFRPLSLLVQEPVRLVPWGVEIAYALEGAQATGELRVTAGNEGATPAQARLKLRLTAPGGACVFTAEVPVTLAPGERTVAVPFALERARVWDIDDPALYALEATLETATGADTVTETCGFRSFAFDGDSGFTLNGRSRKLYGVNLHHDGGACFGAATPRAVLRRRLLRLREMGCNAVRCSHNPHDEALYQLCDELGLLVIDELYDKWTQTELYFERLHESDWRDDLRRLVLRDRNHPCVILWSMGNELEVQYTEFFYRRLTEMRDECRRLDPTRPVTVALVGFCGGAWSDRTPLPNKLAAALRYAALVDVFCGNYMENYYTALREAGMRKPILGTEVFSYYRHAELTTTGVLASSPWRDVDERPYVAGGFVWAGVDYLGESTGYPCKGWAGCPIDSAGFFKLRAWHLRAQWSREPLVRIGVYDAEHVPWDGANSMWSFPELCGHWNGSREGRMRHVAVMTNCDEVRVYLNDEPARIGSPDTPDRLAHFYIPYRKGALRAEGWRDGRKLAEQTLITTSAPAALTLRAEPTAPGDGGLVQAEAWLVDEQGQPWEQSRPWVRFAVEGQATLVGVDNGDFMDDFDPHGDGCRLQNGHAIAYVRLLGGFAKLRAPCMAAPGSVPELEWNEPPCRRANVLEIMCER